MEGLGKSRVSPGCRVAVAVIAKAPIAGRVKTRLGRSIGHAEAAALYRGFLLDTLDTLNRAVEPFDPGRFLVCPDELHAAALTDLIGRPWRVIVQRAPGLMRAIVDAFRTGFAADADVVAATDADSPTVSSAAIARCIRAADSHDLVLGPTSDGGYYLIAAPRRAATRLPELLLETAYDSASICAATIRRAEELGLSTYRGPLGFDVDTLEELDALRADLRERPADELPWTRAALDHLDVRWIT